MIVGGGGEATKLVLLSLSGALSEKLPERHSERKMTVQRPLFKIFCRVILNSRLGERCSSNSGLLMLIAVHFPTLYSCSSANVIGRLCKERHNVVAMCRMLLIVMPKVITHIGGQFHFLASAH